MKNEAVTLLPSLMRNLDIFSSRLGLPHNTDAIVRRFRAGALEAAIIAVDGMTDAKTVNENILKPCMELSPLAGADVPGENRLSFLMAHAVSVLPMKMKDNVDEILADALGGQCVLLCEGCAMACVMDMRGFEKRTIGRPEAEKVVLGAHESFSESIRTSITLVRRIVQREELTTEFLFVGGKMKTRCALLYLRGTADEEIIARIKKRLLSCSSDFPLSCGDVEQVIESHPLALIPQCVRTERPDRAASFLAEGQVLILTDGSPEALGAPATLFHQLHTPDDSSMRWQYGTFLRAVRLIGVLVHLFLPGLYLSVLRFHPELLSAMLLTSVYETGARVPFPAFLEALLMTLAFDLITEAGLRAPGALGSALGIVSGLILGQSAVSADIVSPLLLIVVAASGLGGFCVPGYALGLGLRIIKLLMMAAGALGGLYAIALLTAALLCLLCAMTSLGSPLTAPVAPQRARNADLLLRLPLRLQKAAAFYADNRAQQRRDVRAMRVRSALRAQACAAALCVGAGVLALGAGAAMALSLHAAYIAALSCVPVSALLAALCRRLLYGALCGKKPGAFPCLLSALSLLLQLVMLMSALILFAEQTFLSQARTAFVVLTALLFLLVCLAGGERGAVRAAYALRLLAPALLLARLVLAFLQGAAPGLYPLLGPGGGRLSVSALAMAACASPVLMLRFAPEEEISPKDLPGAFFFAWRAAAGAAVGAGLLFCLSLSSPHEILSSLTGWGERLALAGAAGGPGLFSALTTMAALALFLLSAAVTALGGAQALAGAFPGLNRRASAFLLAGAAGLALALMTVFGFDAALGAGVLSGVLAVPALIFGGKKR